MEASLSIFLTVGCEPTVGEGVLTSPLPPLHPLLQACPLRCHRHPGSGPWSQLWEEVTGGPSTLGQPQAGFPSRAPAQPAGEEAWGQGQADALQLG